MSITPFQPRMAFGYTTAARLAADLTPRRNGESIYQWQPRVDNATCALLRASVQQGGKLRRFLTITHRFYPAELAFAELKILAIDVLRGEGAAKPAPALTLLNLHLVG